MKNTINIGKKVRFLQDYNFEVNFEVGTIVSEGTKNFKILASVPWMIPNHTYTVSKEKCALLDECVCIVWETWKGVNGRGGYRVERDLYPENRVIASSVARQHVEGRGRVEETQRGVLRV